MPQRAFSSVQPTTVYYHKYRWLFFLIAFLIVGIDSYYIGLGNPFLTLFSLVYVLWMLMLGQVLRIVISPAGIAYHNMGFYVIESSWLNVDRIIAVPTFLGSIRCLTLRSPAVRGWTGLAWLIRAPERGRTIPLSGGWARIDQLQQQIRQYAPHVRD